MDTKELFDGLAAIGSIGAVVFAAWSAFLSLRATRAAERSAASADANWRTDRAPVLIADLDFKAFSIEQGDDFDPIDLKLAPTPGPNAAKPSFTVTNYGKSPALDLRIIFQLIDEPDKLKLPEKVNGFKVKVVPSPGDEQAFPSLSFEDLGRTLVLTPAQPMYLPSCAPGQTRAITFPENILTWLWVRAIGADQLDEDRLRLKLRLTIAAKTLEGDTITAISQFLVTSYVIDLDDSNFEVTCIVRQIPAAIDRASSPAK